MQRLQTSDITLIKSEINVSFRPGTLTPFIPSAQGVIHHQPPSSSQIHAETSAPQTQTSCSSELDVSCAACSAQEQRGEQGEAAEPYLGEGWGAARSWGSTARGGCRRCWCDRRSAGRPHAPASGHPFLSGNICHCTPGVSQKRTTGSCEILITSLNSNIAQWEPFTLRYTLRVTKKIKLKESLGFTKHLCYPGT